MPSFHWSSNTAIRMCYQYITIQSATHGIYLHPYYCFRHEENYSKGFSVGNDTTHNQHTTFLEKILMISEWGNNIYTALSNEKIPPKDCDTHKFIIWNHYPSGYEAIYSLILANHPNNLTQPIDIIAAPPTQLKAGYPISKYFHIQIYYL